jgi:hypothetical protein
VPGALIGVTDLIRSESIARVLESRVPAVFLDMNQQFSFWLSHRFDKFVVGP